MLSYLNVVNLILIMVFFSQDNVCFALHAHVGSVSYFVFEGLICNCLDILLRYV